MVFLSLDDMENMMEKKYKGKYYNIFLYINIFMINKRVL